MPTNSQLNIRADITRLKNATSSRRGNEALMGPVSFEQTLAKALSAIQDSIDAINERLKALEG